MEVGIPDGRLGGWPTAAGIFVQQEAKDIQQEEDRDNVQIREKTLKITKKNFKYNKNCTAVLLKVPQIASRNL